MSYLEFASATASITDLDQRYANEDGSYHGIRQIVSIPLNESVVGDFITFSGREITKEHLVIGLGPWRDAAIPLVRIHSECLTGDVFGSQKCDCGQQLQESIAQISRDGGFLIYLRQEGRGIGLYNKLDAYALQNNGFDTFEANQILQFPDDLRDFRCAAEMLKVLGCKSIRLLSNNPDKVAQLERHGVKVVARINTGLFLTESNAKYIEAKRVKAGHKL